MRGPTLHVLTHVWRCGVRPEVSSWSLALGCWEQTLVWAWKVGESGSRGGDCRGAGRRGGDTGRSVDTHIHINHLYHGTWDEPMIPFAFRPRWLKSLVVARSSLRWSSGRATCIPGHSQRAAGVVERAERGSDQLVIVVSQRVH